MKITNTPDKSWQLAVIGSAAYLLWPITEYVYFWEDLRRGTYPIDADSISIPIFHFLVGWLVLAPLYILVLYLSCRNYRPQAPLFRSPKLKTKELFWSMLFGAVILYWSFEIFWAVREFHLFSILNAILQIWVALLMHASLLHKSVTNDEVT